MEQLDYKYFCNTCGRLLIRSVKPIENVLEVVCTRTSCKKKQIVCGQPKPFEVQVAGMMKKGQQYSAERELIKRRFWEHRKQV